MGNTSNTIAKKRNSAIDLLKFLYAFMILFHHTYQISGVGKENGIFLSGLSAVDFYFITAGYFMAISIIKNSKSPHPQGLGSETVVFLKKRIAPLLPYIVTGFITALITRILVQGTNYFTSTTKLMNSIWELLLLRMAGFDTTKINNVTWYLSAMFICMFFLYPIIRKNINLWVNAICPAGGIMLYGFIIAEFSSLRQPSTYWCGFAYKGTLRALAGIMLGIGIYALCQRFKSYEFKPFFTWLLSIVEWSGYIATFIITYHIDVGTWDPFIVLLFAISITITCSGHSALSNKITFKFTQTLGKFGTVLFLNHYFLTWVEPVILDYFYPAASPNERIIIFVILSLSWAALIMLVVETLTKLHPFKRLSDFLIISR